MTTVGAERQSVCGDTWRRAHDLEQRPSQPARYGMGSDHRRDVGMEHGPSGGDEINIIERGRNYGWGVVSKGLQNGITKRSQDGMVEPLTYYTPSLGLSQVAFYTGNRFPGWKNTSLFVGGMEGTNCSGSTLPTTRSPRGSDLRPVRPRARHRSGPRRVLLSRAAESDRLRDGLPLSASTPGRIIRLVPATAGT